MIMVHFGHTSDHHTESPSYLDLLPFQPGLQGDMRELGAAITRDIFTANPNVSLLE